MCDALYAVILTSHLALPAPPHLRSVFAVGSYISLLTIIFQKNGTVIPLLWLPAKYVFHVTLCYYILANYYNKNRPMKQTALKCSV